MFAGVNAHHQNGIAERRIRELQELTRTMLIFANRRWPKMVTANLWPYALRMANTVYNVTPSLQDKERRSPDQQFSFSGAVNLNPKHWKPFGCPVYALKNELQQSKIYGKWNPRSRLGIYLGQSPIHNQNVALVLDIESGYMSPQFHVKFDTSFHTVRQQTMPKSTWLHATKFIEEKDKRTNLDQPKTASPQTKWRKHVHFSEGEPMGPPMPPSEGAKPAPQGPKTGPKHAKIPTSVHNQRVQGATTPRDTNLPQKQGRTSQPADREEVAATPGKLDSPNGLRRSRREKQPSKRLIEVMYTEIERNAETKGEIFAYETMYPRGSGSACQQRPLLAYKASTDPDTMYMHEAMREPDKVEFLKAMEKEVEDQMKNGNYSIVNKNDVPKSSTILPAVWQMKRKRDIKTREVKKYKARLNIDGSKMRPGVHYDLTYAPVASWTSVRLLMALTALNGWHTKQIDYVLAFPQAPVEKELFMRIPRGFEVEGVDDPKNYVLKLHRNVYGQKQAGRVWNRYLVKKLTEDVGFVQSKVDECILYKGNVIYLLYTDDTILAGPDKSEIDEVIEQIRGAKLDITVEGDLQDFLGVRITREADGSVHFTQPHLIDKILKDLRLDNDEVTTRDVPARSSVLLSRHTDSKDFDGVFNYRSIIGMLGYLETTRSDISYAVHQCARFSTAPKVEHGKAVNWLARYLKGTRDKGTIFRPDSKRGLEVFVDADFAGNWDKNEAGSDPDTARSRHGYIIMYAGCPIIWKSQLQMEIALSSTESEYTGLSYALWEAIPIMDLLDEMSERGFKVSGTKAKMHCKVFEDNSGALEIAKNPKYRPRTKHLNVKLHHFRSYVADKRISIHKIDTKEQLADYLTKPVPVLILTYLRKFVMGW